MKVCFDFFEDESWSILATIKTAVALLLFFISGMPINVKTLILASLIGMMNGKLVDLCVFSVFFSLVLWINSTGTQIALVSIAVTIAAILISRVCCDNEVLKKWIEKWRKNVVFEWGFRFVISLWMLWITYLVIGIIYS